MIDQASRDLFLGAPAAVEVTAPPHAPQPRASSRASVRAHGLDRFVDMDALWQIVSQDPGLYFWVLGEDDRIAYCSPQSAQLICERDPDQVVGERLDELMPVGPVARLTSLRRRVHAEGRSIIGRVLWKGQRLRSTYQPGLNGSMLVFTRRDPRGMHDEEPGVFEADYVELGPLETLTSRELEVLALMGEGLRIKDIADRLERSYKTVCSFRDSIGRKLGITDRGELVSLARCSGLEPRHAALPRAEIRRS